MSSSSSHFSTASDIPHEGMSTNERFQEIQKSLESVAEAIIHCDGEYKEFSLVQNILTSLREVICISPTRTRPLDYSNLEGVQLQEETFLRIMKFLAEPRTCPTYCLEAREMAVLFLLQFVHLEFKDVAYLAAFLEYALNWLENRFLKVSQQSGPHANLDSITEALGWRIIKLSILSKLLICDKERKHETRILNLSWLCAQTLGEYEQLDWLGKIAQNYTIFPEVEHQVDFIKMDKVDRASFLYACSKGDTNTFSKYVGAALNQTKVYGEIAKTWAEKENSLHSIPTTSSKLANALSIDFPISTMRLQTAKNCLDRLDFTKNLTAALNPYNCDTFESVMTSVMSPELTVLNTLNKEAELQLEVVHKVKSIRTKHLHEYESMKKQQYERLDEIFRACQKETEDVIKEALYKKAKLLTTVDKASSSSTVASLSSEEILKKIVRESGTALKAVEDKMEAQTTEKMLNSECALCFMEFTGKHKRACLDPCGHINVCYLCAIKAWKTNRYCPICRGRIKKPIPLPAQLYS